MIEAKIDITQANDNFKYFEPAEDSATPQELPLHHLQQKFSPCLLIFDCPLFLFSGHLCLFFAPNFVSQLPLFSSFFLITLSYSPLKKQSCQRA